MDQSAVGHEYVAKVEKHASQKDYSAGFGGKYGIQKDRIDKVIQYLFSVFRSDQRGLVNLCAKFDVFLT